MTGYLEFAAVYGALILFCAWRMRVSLIGTSAWRARALRR